MVNKINKLGKKIKLDNNKEKLVFQNEEIPELDPEELELYSNFEKKIHKGRYIMHKKQQFQQSGSKIKSVAYQSNTGLLIIGFKNGVFGLYRILEEIIESLQTLAVSEGKISSICFNNTRN